MEISNQEKYIKTIVNLPNGEFTASTSLGEVTVELLGESFKTEHRDEKRRKIIIKREDGTQISNLLYSYLKRHTRPYDVFPIESCTEDILYPEFATPIFQHIDHEFSRNTKVSFQNKDGLVIEISEDSIDLLKDNNIINHLHQRFSVLSCDVSPNLEVSYNLNTRKKEIRLIKREKYTSSSSYEGRTPVSLVTLDFEEITGPALKWCNKKIEGALKKLTQDISKKYPSSAPGFIKSAESILKEIVIPDIPDNIEIIDEKNIELVEAYIKYNHLLQSYHSDEFMEAILTAAFKHFGDETMPVADKPKQPRFSLHH